MESVSKARRCSTWKRIWDSSTQRRHSAPFCGLPKARCVFQPLGRCCKAISKMPPQLGCCCRALLLLLAAVLCAAQREVPAPRLLNKDWEKCWKRELGEMRRAERTRRPFHLLLYGDSLVESWRGTDHCLPCNETVRSTCRGAPQLLRKYFGRWRPGVMGIAGGCAGVPP
jgi:hypothetical protein